MSELRRDRDSFEYLEVTVTASVVLDDQPVAIAVTRGRPSTDDWQTAAWQGEPGTTRKARIGPITPPGSGVYAVRARVTDSPEIPVIDAGHITFT